ncbi:MAG: gamma-glutamylcyclotransferase [Desulfobaccales bacterium]
MTTWEELRGLVRAHLEAARRSKTLRPSKLDLKQARRLRLASRLVLPPVELVLGRPQERLIVYGTLAPGGRYHHLLADLKAVWERCLIRGRLRTYRGYPAFKWNPAGEAHPAWLVTSPFLAARFPELDRFEGGAYSRRLIPAQAGRRLVIAYIYEGKVKA